MNNEYYGAPTTPTIDYLMHYGVKGMKWGVRKLVKDRYANPSKQFTALYGSKSKKRNMTPRAMQRHYNQLDKSYVKIRAKEEAKIMEYNDMLRAAKRNNKRSDAEKERFSEAFKDAVRKGSEYSAQTKNIDRMKRAIASKAKLDGYDVKTRYSLRVPLTRIRGRGIGGVPISAERVKIRSKHH